MLARFLQRGDTIIEVLLAVTVFSLVAVGGLTIMNQGTNTAQRAVEITLVRQQIDAQAEALRAIHQAAARGIPAAESEWGAVTTDAEIAGVYNGESCPGATATSLLPGGSFALHPTTARKLSGSWYRNSTSATAPPYAQLRTGPPNRSFGIWIEPSKEDGADSQTKGVYTFRIRACWQGAGLSTPMRLETAVRLYEI